MNRAIAAAIAGACACSPAHGQTCGHWLSGEGVPGVVQYQQNTTLKSATVWDPDGDGPAPPIVVALGGVMFAGEAFANTGFATWDGTNWGRLNLPPIPSELIPPTLITTYRGELVVASMTEVALERINLDYFGSFGTRAPHLRGVETLAVVDDTLYVGGAIESVNNQPAFGIAAWDGQTWNNLGTPASWEITTVAGGPGVLHVGGVLWTSGTGFLALVANRTGTRWSVPEAGLPGSGMRVDSVIDHGGQLFAAWSTAGSGYSQLAFWSRGKWWESPDVAGRITQLVEHRGELLVIGNLNHRLSDLGPPFPNSAVIRLGPTQWDALGEQPLTGTASQVVEFNDDLVAIGYLGQAGSSLFQGAARWDGARWNPMGSGIGHPVSIISEWDGQLIAAGGGHLSHATPEGWRLMEDGLLVSGVECFAQAWGRLFAAVDGYYSSATLKEWDGTRWIVASTPSSNFDRLTAIAEYGGELAAAGTYTSNTSPAHRVSNVLSWDGTTWRPLVPGVTGAAYFLLNFQGTLVAAGSFTAPGLNIARWDGRQWTAMGDGLPDVVMGLTEFNGTLYANVYYHGLYRWTGADWVYATPDDWNPTYGGPLAVYHGNLYRTDPEYGVQMLVGSRWVPIDGLSGPYDPNTIYVLGDELVIGSGSPSVADGRTLGYIAKWASGGAPPTLHSTVAPIATVRDGGRTQFPVSDSPYDLVSISILHDGVHRPSTYRYGAPTIDNVHGALTFSVLSAKPEDTGEYIIELANPCGVVRSNAFTLDVRCAADFDGDGRAVPADLFAYLDAWFAKDLSAQQDRIDYRNSTTVTTGDLFAYVARYVSGCE